MDGARRKEAEEKKIKDLFDRALECGDIVGRVTEQARVMFFLLKIESRRALAARLAKHLDSEPSRREREAVRAAVADALGDWLPGRVTMTSDAEDAGEREPKPPEPKPEFLGNSG